MIVRTSNAALDLIRQPDHARLARAVMEHCRPLASHPRRDAILLAIEAHDNGWAEVDDAPTVDPSTGRPHDFIDTPVEHRQGVWPRGVERLKATPWAAALVAHHAVTVYDRFRGDGAWTGFFQRMTDLRDAMRREAGLAPSELEADYAFLRVGDLISLVFCLSWNEEQRFDRWTVRLEGNRVVAGPDLFDGPVRVEVRARVIANRHFTGDEDLRNALRDAGVVTLRGEVSGVSHARMTPVRAR